MGKSAIDPIFKQIITTLFQGWGINVQTEVEVGQLPLRIDVVIGIEDGYRRYLTLSKMKHRTGIFSMTISLSSKAKGIG